MIYIKIQKIKILDILVENGMIISYQTINQIYEYIQQSNKNINFNSFQDLKKKIKTNSTSLKRSFEKVKRKKKRHLIETFNLKLSKEFFELHLEPICFNDQPPVEILFESLFIEQPQIETFFTKLKLS